MVLMAERIPGGPLDLRILLAGEAGGGPQRAPREQKVTEARGAHLLATRGLVYCRLLITGHDAPDRRTARARLELEFKFIFLLLLFLLATTTIP